MTLSEQAKQSRLYARAFGRGVYSDILRWGDSETLTHLCLLESHDPEETYHDCIRRFYGAMKRNYRCEYVFKNEIIANLKKEYAGQQTLIVNEFRVGNSIADLAFFNGESRAYEIKTAYDSPRRLVGQMDDYRKLFDECYLVVEEGELHTWKPYAEDGLGLMLVCHGPKGKIKLEKYKDSSRQESIDVDALMTCLRAEEYEHIAEAYAGTVLSKQKDLHYRECKDILKQMDEVALHTAFLETIEQRKSSFDLLKRTPKELFQVCMSMHLTETQLETIILSLNNKVNG